MNTMNITGENIKLQLTRVFDAGVRQNSSFRLPAAGHH
jgi:hypothetical protein